MAAHVQWLGQAGFALETSAGDLCLVDPYLSDDLQAEMNLARVADVVRNPAETSAAVCVTSHWHPDHLDRATCRALLGANPRIRFVGPPSNIGRLAMWHVPAENLISLGRGQAVDVGPFRINGCFARHDVPGWICEDALTFVIEMDGLRGFHTGDTEYDARVRRDVRPLGRIDLGLFSIPGTGGNMHAREAALMALDIAPMIASPMHYGMWRAADYGDSDDPEVERPTLDPRLFVEAYRGLGGGQARIFELGERIPLTVGGHESAAGH